MSGMTGRSGSVRTLGNPTMGGGNGHGRRPFSDLGPSRFPAFSPGGLRDHGQTARLPTEDVLQN